MFIFWYTCPQDIKERFVLETQDNSTTNAGGERRVGDFKEMPSAASILILGFFLAVYTSIHLAAWNYPFTSTTEAWIWRSLSIATFVLGVSILMMAIWKEKSTKSLAFLSVAAYTLVRLGVTGLAFAAFRKAPAGIYLTPSWSAYWGHIGA